MTVAELLVFLSRFPVNTQVVTGNEFVGGLYPLAEDNIAIKELTEDDIKRSEHENGGSLGMIPGPVLYIGEDWAVPAIAFKGE